MIVVAMLMLVFVYVALSIYFPGTDEVLRGIVTAIVCLPLLDVAKRMKRKKKRQ